MPRRHPGIAKQPLDHSFSWPISDQVGIFSCACRALNLQQTKHPSVTKHLQAIFHLVFIRSSRVLSDLICRARTTQRILSMLGSPLKHSQGPGYHMSLNFIRAEATGVPGPQELLFKPLIQKLLIEVIQVWDCTVQDMWPLHKIMRAAAQEAARTCSIQSGFSSFLTTFFFCSGSYTRLAIIIGMLTEPFTRPTSSYSSAGLTSR
jgi:hypothetical protein